MITITLHKPEFNNGLSPEHLFPYHHIDSLSLCDIGMEYTISQDSDSYGNVKIKCHSNDMVTILMFWDGVPVFYMEFETCEKFVAWMYKTKPK